MSVNLTSDQLLWLKDYFERRHKEGHRWVILPGLDEAMREHGVTREQFLRFIKEQSVAKEGDA